MNKAQKVMIVLIVGGVLVLMVLVNTPNPEKIDMSKIQISASLDAQQLENEYSANEISADNRYKDNWIELTGYVHTVRKDILGDVFVDLNIGYGLGIQCYFSDSNAVSSLSQGQKLTVVGLCKGKIGISPVLKNCVIR